MRTSITRFTNKYRWLSNFFQTDEVQCRLGNLGFRSVEAGYQAAKCQDPEDRLKFTNITPFLAKKAGQKVSLPKNWDKDRLVVMTDLVRQKFQLPELRTALLSTGETILIEGNHWGDTFWGQCPVGNGQNHLGRILMEVRREIQNDAGHSSAKTSNTREEAARQAAS